MPVFMFLSAFANLFGIGGSSIISRFLGLKQKGRAENCSAFCIWAGIAASVLYEIVNFIFRKPLFDILGASEDTLSYLNSYVFWTVTIGTCPTTALNFGIITIFQATGTKIRPLILFIPFFKKISDKQK